MTQPLMNTTIEGFPCRRGKVRDIYDLGEQILIVATDRISAFDVVLPTVIPHKGTILTRLSEFWFNRLSDITSHHLIKVIDTSLPHPLEPSSDQLRGRAMLCRKAQVVPIECVVRGYLAGSGWKEYQQTGSVCGIKLPTGLLNCDRLPEPIFTPSTKAESGHDQNISFEQAGQLVGLDTIRSLRDKSLAVYQAAFAFALQRGIIIADTKFEWGWCDQDLILIDEVLTPDSSRFWPAASYQPGQDQPSFDKQFVRDYLQDLCNRHLWDKTPPAPALPPDVVNKTSQKYIEAYQHFTDHSFEPA